jgi:GNAT superfamily N-acetyltransferase
LVLRPAEDADLDEIAAIHIAARAAAPMPVGVHADREVRGWLARRLAVDEVWVAELDGRVAAYARFTRTWLDDLYVAPGAQRDGLGGALLELVKSLRPQGFGLWVFESNLPARQFYARHGLVEVERTDGSANEEREPDIRMVWDPSD